MAQPPGTPTATITIRVVGGALQYAIAGAGLELGPGRHRVAKNTNMEWTCPDGDFAVQFGQSPFTSGAMAVSAAQGQTTAPEKTKNSNTRRRFKYFVAVKVAGNPPILTEDPELEAGGNPGGGGRGKKKKTASKKKKTAKK